MISLVHSGNEHQLSVNEFLSSILDNQIAMQWHQPIIEICAAFMGKIEGDSIAAAF
jgi:hypothetical protein